ncbi:MAG TPA: DMT family transporter [Streptosporangiaceae bacterium]|nr:DMT family transporter [Streptosporangiaceae bacterium]
MSNGIGISVAVLAAVGAASAFGVGVALQHRQAQLTTTGQTPWRLLAALARRRRWLAGIGLAVAAYGLQALALAFGPLVLVAPIVATDLLFALPLAAVWARKSMRPADWAGCLLAAGGVGIFLASSQPSAGRSDAPAEVWVLAFGLVALISAAALVAGRRSGRRAGTASLAVAAGTVFGLTAAVTLSMTRQLRFNGVISMLTNWQPWVLICLGIAGLMLSAKAYQAGDLAASLPIMDTVEPLSGVLLGTLVLGERLAASPPRLVLQLVAATAATTGIIVLRRAPSVQAVGHDAAIRQCGDGR